MKPSTLKGQPPFDKQAHELLVALLAEAQRRAVERGRCRPANANRLLTERYISECADFLSGASAYLEVEEYGAANCFLVGLIERGMVRQFNKHVGIMAKQLANHTSLYFPDHEPLLERRFIAFMASELTSSDVDMSGLLRQAIATLPYAEAVVRRQFRIAGLKHEKLFIPNDVKRRRMIGRSID